MRWWHNQHCWQSLLAITSCISISSIHLIFRKEGGHYGFTASISDQDNEKLVVGNPLQRTHVWDKARVRKKTFSKCLYIKTNSTFSTPNVDLTNHWQKKGDSYSCGSVGEVNPGNVFKAPGFNHPLMFILHQCLPVRSVSPWGPSERKRHRLVSFHLISYGVTVEAKNGISIFKRCGCTLACVSRSIKAKRFTIASCIHAHIS